MGHVPVRRGFTGPCPMRKNRIMLTVMGIETSCDETAAAVVRQDGTVLADAVLSQEAEHAAFAGVVPEVAARAHLAHLEPMIRQAMERAAIGWGDLDGIAATTGPGLIGGVMVGAMTAKALALALGKPFVSVNHLEGHALSARLSDGLDFPYLLLLASGGHTQLLMVEGVGEYRRLGTTIDDALGEAFDKTAKLLGLGYPGGPAIERLAESGDPDRFSLPRPMAGRAGCDFSFSGLKTAVRRTVERDLGGQPGDADKADLAASFQQAALESVVDRTTRGIALFRSAYPERDGLALVAAGGVAANRALRLGLAELAETAGLAFVAPPLRLCTDNGAMIAWAGIERLRLGLSDGLDAPVRPRWPLDPTAPPASGAGVKA